MNAAKLKPHKVEEHESGSRTEHYHVTTHAQALQLMKRASRYHAHVSMSAYLTDNDDQYKPGYYRACAELTKAAMLRYLEDAIGHAAPDANEYCNVRLYAYYLPGRYNHKTMREGKPRRRVTFYIG
jgi:hypothetical protein